MKVRQFFAVVIFLFLFACDKPEEIVPAAPAVSEPTPLTPAGDSVDLPVQVPQVDSTVVIDSVISVVGTDSVVSESASYDYDQIGSFPVRILYPKNYDSKVKYPLVLFLHGMGERGTDNEKQLTWGASHFLQDSIRSLYPAIVVFPQCPVDRYWFDDQILNQLSNLVNTLIEDLPLDESRLYIGGLSMGAYGTYALTSHRPGLFAAAIAISGDGDPNEKAKMAKTKNWWLFAGKRDLVVRSAKTEKMAKALKEAKANVKLTLYENADHAESWIFAFAEPQFTSWLFSKRK